MKYSDDFSLNEVEVGDIVFYSYRNHLIKEGLVTEPNKTTHCVKVVSDDSEQYIDIELVLGIARDDMLIYRDESIPEEELYPS